MQKGIFLINSFFGDIMTVTSTLYKNTSQINEPEYEKFVQQQFNAIRNSWHFFDPDGMPTEEEMMVQAEDICSMYRHHFRIRVMVK